MLPHSLLWKSTLLMFKFGKSLSPRFLSMEYKEWALLVFSYFRYGIRIRSTKLEFHHLFRNAHGYLTLGSRNVSRNVYKEGPVGCPDFSANGKKQAAISQFAGRFHFEDMCFQNSVQMRESQKRTKMWKPNPNQLALWIIADCSRSEGKMAWGSQSGGWFIGSYSVQIQRDVI